MRSTVSALLGGRSQYHAAWQVLSEATLLIRTDKPVERIGEECGFNDNSYFGRTFRRYYGISPAAYRKCSGDYPINSDCDYDMGEEDVT